MTQRHLREAELQSFFSSVLNTVVGPTLRPL